MSDVVYSLYQQDRLRWVVEDDQLPAALAAMHQSGVSDVEVRTADGRPPAPAELSTRYLTTDEFCGFHVFEAAVSLAGEEIVRTRYSVPGCACTATPHRSCAVPAS
ncbi:hypothetical protein [Cryptosporangium phraense]|uniref:Uncharacterized protein n=1 Tax=Cryptosporangium phraense TaxID=2593070 RepID=A0A545AZD3_9ACTN|nr:hypothetical protein [Cryptosporangium phraense]TQS45955.1 hypothetical protein FL583_05530 [Cryptosporangium phraense]